MGVEKTAPRRAINKKTKKTIVFDEKKRKEFLTGFKKRKDERRKKWTEKVERDLKNEIKKIKEETKSKVRYVDVVVFSALFLHGGKVTLGKD